MSTPTFTNDQFVLLKADLTQYGTVNSISESGVVVDCAGFVNVFWLHEGGDVVSCVQAEHLQPMTAKVGEDLLRDAADKWYQTGSQEDLGRFWKIDHIIQTWVNTRPRVCVGKILGYDGVQYASIVRHLRDRPYQWHCQLEAEDTSIAFTGDELAQFETTGHDHVESSEVQV